MATTTGLSIDDFERLPAEAAKNRELVDGELIDVSGNTLGHNLLRDLLLATLKAWLDARPYGTVVCEQEYDFQGNAHGPDVSFFGIEKQALTDRQKRVQRFVPDLVIEVASESDTYVSMIRKKERYRRAGTREVWLISMETREIAAYSTSADRVWRSGDVLTSDILPGFELQLDELFQDF